jgi:hypothetical protein
MKRRKGKLPPFVPLIRTTLASPAWKQLSFGARSLYVVLRSYLRVDNLNNGKVYRSYREAATDLGTNSMRSIHRWFCELEHYGFIVKTRGACLGVDGDGIAPHWRLTECPTFDSNGTHIAPTRDFDRWDGTLFDDPLKTESRFPNECTPHPKGNHTGNPKQDPKPPKCTQNGDIDSAASMHSKGAHNCLPLPQPSKPALKPWTTPTLIEVSEWSAPVGSAVATERAPTSLIPSSGSRRLH